MHLTVSSVGQTGETNQEQRGEKKRRNLAVFVTTLRGLLQECDNGLCNLCPVRSIQ